MSEEPVVIISPHPDDETLGVGGLIFSLSEHHVPVTVVAVTDGENAYEGISNLGQLREREQALALKQLGVSEESIVRFRLPDSGLHLCEEELIDLLRTSIPAGSHLIAPWSRDFHPDHEVCGRAAAAIAAEKNIPLTSYIFWTWHRGTPETLSGEALSAFPLSDHAIRAKQRALHEHASQLAYPGQSPILPSELLWPMDLAFEVLLP